MNWLDERSKLPVIIIALVALTLFANTLTGKFVWDDHSLVEDNPGIEHFGNIASAFTKDMFEGAGCTRCKEHFGGYYRPVFMIYLILNYALWGEENAFGYHLSGYLLNVAACLLVYALALKLVSRREAFLAALIFTVHPAHSEAVAWVSAHSELLMALFVLAAFYCYVLFRESKRLPFLAGSVLCFMLALFSKEAAIIYPLVVLLYEIFLRRGAPWYRWLFPGLFLGCAIPYFILRERAVVGFSTLDVLSGYPLSWTFFTSVTVLGEYLQNLFLPIDLRVIYDLVILKSPMDPGVIVSSVILVSYLSIIAVSGLKKKWLYCFLLTFSLLVLLPYLGQIPLQKIYGSQTVKSRVIFDRYLYLSSFGFAVLMASVSLQVRQRLQAASEARRALAVTAFALVMAVFCAITVQRNTAWKSDLSFFTQATYDAPTYVGARRVRAILLMKNLMLELETITKTDPESTSAYDAHEKLQKLYEMIGDVRKAEENRKILERLKGLGERKEQPTPQ